MSNYTSFNLSGILINAGPNPSVAIAKELKRLGVTRPLIVTDCGIEQAGIIDKVKSLLAQDGLTYAIYDGVKTDPLDQMVEEGLAVYREAECNGILSVGGGSSMDTGKCISIMSAHEGHILEYSNYARRSLPNYRLFRKRGCPIVAVPTTAGTGSEVSQAAVITNSETHRKTTLATSLFMSNSVVLVPEFTATMKPEITAYTAMDALSHAIEAYTSKPAIENNVLLCDVAALEAIRLIAEDLPLVYDNGNDLQARAKMQWAALMAGIALNICAGESHALGSMLAKYYGVCHGISVGIPLPYCMEYNLYSSYPRFRKVAEAMGVSTQGMSDEEGAKAAVEAVKALQRRVNFPKMRDYIKDIAEVQKFSEECAGNSCCIANGRMTTKEAIEQVFRQSMEE